MTLAYLTTLNCIAQYDDEDDSSTIPPLFVTGGREWSVWSQFIFDATKLGGGDHHSHHSTTTSSSTPSSSILNQRNDYVASCQEHYFRTPPQIERGYRQFMYDVNGRGYLDTVNNVAVVGHGHPLIAENVYKQLLILNTNSRFLYQSLGKFAEEIISTIPQRIRNDKKLNRVVFVNSGSEATDLAMRIARTVVSERRMKETATTSPSTAPSMTVCAAADSSAGSGTGAPAPATAGGGYGVHRDIICVEGGYHGITTASDEVSTTLNDNPR